MSIEAMKQALATIDKIIDGCNNVQEENDIHGDAKTLAKLTKKDCFPTLEALCQAIAEAEKQEPAFYVIPATDRFGEGYEQTYWEDPAGFPVYTRPVYASDMSQERVDETAKDRHGFEEMVKKGTKAWADTPDDWVDELRGGAEKQEDLARVGEVGVWGHQREWVGLTHEERDEIDQNCKNHMQVIFAVEATLKEKNS